jgi:heme-degrading monooxygenase HmoA
MGMPVASGRFNGTSFIEEQTVIARMWHGYTTPENADKYEAMLKPEVLPGVGGKQGYKGSYFLRRDLGSEVEFVTIMLWESLDAIRTFAGPNYETAIVPPERRKVLKRFDERAAHFEVVLQP